MLSQLSVPQSSLFLTNSYFSGFFFHSKGIDEIVYDGPLDSNHLTKAVLLWVPSDVAKVDCE